MNTFKNEQYTITTSLSDHSIYIKIVNNVSYATYEGTFEKQAFRLSFELAGIYRLINKCFAAFTDGGDNKYSVAAELEPSGVRLAFHCAIEEFIELDFEIRLKEKVVSGDSAVSMELEKQKQIIEMLNEKVEKQATELMELEKQKQIIEMLNEKVEKQATELMELKKQTQITEMINEKVEKQATELMELKKQTQITEMINEKVEKQVIKIWNEFTDFHRKYNELTKMFIDQQANMAAEFTNRLETANRENRLKIQKHEQLIEQLGFAEIELTDGSTVNSIGALALNKYFPLNATCLVLDGHRNNISNEVLGKIKYFYKLETLLLRNCGSNNSSISGYLNPMGYLSGTFTKLILVDSNHADFGSMLYLSNLPKLTELTMIRCIISPQAVMNLRSIKHNVKKFSFELRTDMPSFNKNEMQLYCKENGIELILN